MIQCKRMADLNGVAIATWISVESPGIADGGVLDMMQASRGGAGGHVNCHRMKMESPSFRF